MKIETTMTVEKIDPITENVLGEFELDIIGNFTPEERGSRGFYGEQMEPDYPAKVEFEVAYLDGEEYDLTREEIARAEALLWDAIPEKDSEY
jgi:hypothetical protein